MIGIAMQQLPCLARSPQAYRRIDRGHAGQRIARAEDQRPGRVRVCADVGLTTTSAMLNRYQRRLKTQHGKVERVGANWARPTIRTSQRGRSAPRAHAPFWPAVDSLAGVPVTSNCVCGRS